MVVCLGVHAWCFHMRLENCIVHVITVWHIYTMYVGLIIHLLVVKVPSAGSPRILPDIGDTTTV